MLKPSKSSPTNAPADAPVDDYRVPEGGPDENDTEGRLTCDVCGKQLYTRQIYRGRIRCFDCADKEHRRIERHQKSKAHDSFTFDFKWDEEPKP